MINRMPTTPEGKPDVGPKISLLYNNWRGETGRRTVSPVGIWYGVTEYHKKTGWLLHVWDWDKGDWRDYELAACNFITPETET